MHVAIGMARALWPDQARVRTACRLFIRQDPTDSSSEVIGWGSGFHYGDGWIVTTGRVAGVNAANVSSLWVQLYEPVPETPGQVWRTFPPRRRFSVYLHIAGQADFRDYDIVAFQLHLGEENTIQGITDVPGAIPLVAQQFPSTFAAYCIDYGADAGAAMPDVPQVTRAQYSIVPGSIFPLRNSPWPSLQNSQWPLFYQTPVAARNGSSGAPVFGASGQFVGVHFIFRRQGFIVSFAFVHLFMINIKNHLGKNLQRLRDCESILPNRLTGPLRFTTKTHIADYKKRIQQNLRAMPWPMRCHNEDELH